MHLHGNFRHIGGWSACKLALLITLSCHPGLQATPLHNLVHCCLWIIIFPHKNANFRIKWQKHGFDHKNKLQGNTDFNGFFSFFLKSINLKVQNLTAPSKRSGRFFWSWNNIHWIWFLYQFKFVWCKKATDQILGRYSLTSKTSYRKISWNIEAVNFGFRLFQSLWNLTGTSAAVLLRWSNFRAMRL